jgi:hypothetical protein
VKSYNCVLSLSTSADEVALANTGYPQSAMTATFAVQYADCSAEFLHLLDLSRVGAPCTVHCQHCNGGEGSVMIRAEHHRRMWVLKAHDTPAIRALRMHVLGASNPVPAPALRTKQAQSKPAKRKRSVKIEEI